MKTGDLVWERIDNEVVRIVSIGKATKHYGPERDVRVRFADGHSEYYARNDVRPLAPNRPRLKLGDKYYA